MRSWLTRLAPIVLAALQLAIPRAAGVAEAELCRAPVRVTPRLVFATRALLVRAEPRASDQRVTAATPFVAASTVQSAAAQRIVVRRSASPAVVYHDALLLQLPHARAPPTQS